MLCGSVQMHRDTISQCLLGNMDRKKLQQSQFQITIVQCAAIKKTPSTATHLQRTACCLHVVVRLARKRYCDLLILSLSRVLFCLMM